MAAEAPRIRGKVLSSRTAHLLLISYLLPWRLISNEGIAMKQEVKGLGNRVSQSMHSGACRRGIAVEEFLKPRVIEVEGNEELLDQIAWIFVQQTMAMEEEEQARNRREAAASGSNNLNPEEAL